MVPGGSWQVVADILSQCAGAQEINLSWFVHSSRLPMDHHLSPIQSSVINSWGDVQSAMEGAGKRKRRRCMNANTHAKACEEQSVPNIVSRRRETKLDRPQWHQTLLWRMIKLSRQGHGNLARKCNGKMNTNMHDKVAYKFANGGDISMAKDDEISQFIGKRVENEPMWKSDA